jgi:hypothetical protein
LFRGRIEEWFRTNDRIVEKERGYTQLKFAAAGFSEGRNIQSENARGGIKKYRRRGHAKEEEEKKIHGSGKE